MISGAVGPGDHEQETSSIWLISILGGEPRKLRSGAYRAVLSPDDALVAYMGKFAIWLADADGDNPRPFIERGPWEGVGSPQWSPDGRRVIYRRVVVTGNSLVSTIESRALDEETSTVLVRDETFPGALNDSFGFIWAKDYLMLDDRLIYVLEEDASRRNERNLWELPIDPQSGNPAGEARRLTDLVGFDMVDLSATADGSQLVFRDNASQSDVYVGELGDGGRRLDNTRRLTLDDRDDLPMWWTPDGRSVGFQSDRYGSEDLFLQALDRRDPQDLAVGAGDQTDPHLTPDGASVLYWESQAKAGEPGNARRLLRIPVAGGPTEPVARSEAAWSGFDCATVPGGACLLFEVWVEEGLLTLSRLDPVAGKGEELWRIPWGALGEEQDTSNVNVRSALSPDGTRFAMVGHTREPSIRLTEVLGGATRDLDVEGAPGLSFQDVEWAPDGSGFYVEAESGRASVLLRVDLEGQAYALHENPTGQILLPRPSPDGRHLAFGEVTAESNVWIIEDF